MRFTISKIHLGALVGCLLACDSDASGHVAPKARDASTARAWLEGDGVRLDEATRQYVAVEAVALGANDVTLRAPARVAFRDNAVSRVGAPIPARVMKLHVQVGDAVHVDDPLVTLASPDASGYHAELARARVELSAAQAALSRQEEMLAKGVGREYERVVAEMAVKDAEERVRGAKRDVALLGRSFGGTVIVTSQIDGTVLRRNASIGAQVEPDGEPLLEIGNPDDLWVVADVFQDDLDAVMEGARVRVEVASQFEPLEGRVEAIGVLLDTAVRRAPVYIGVQRTAVTRLKAGMFARAYIHVDASDAVTLPVGAILVKDGDRAVVYVDHDGVFVQRAVDLGHTFENRVEILSGLQAGEQVAVRGTLLIDGAANQLL